MIGNLEKMAATLEAPVSYTLRLSDERVPLNPLLGKEIKLTHSGAIHCMACGRKTKKSFSQGYCYPCFRSLARCDMCIVRPEDCHYDKGTCREPEWGETHCMIPHYVYLANSSGLKVGITRHTQIPTRWIDQGAVEALPIFKVASRYQSGLVEVAFKAHVADRTDWRKMLKGDGAEVDLIARRDELLATCEAPIAELTARFGEDAITPLTDEAVVSLSYPILEAPKKVKSFNFDKTPEVSGTLMGIKGQYLMLDGGVINLRKFRGYEVSFEAP